MRNGMSLIGLMCITQIGVAQTQGTSDRFMPPPVIEPFHPATTVAKPAPPTAQQRLKDYWKGLIDPYTLLGAGAAAGIGQWRDSPKEWGQGAKGYGRRFASGFSDHVVYGSMLYGASSLFHEDNRYFQSGESGFGPRLKYALESTVLARHYDADGRIRRRISISQISALAGAALISRLWQPHSTGGLQNAAVSFGVSLGAWGGFNVAREFMPGLVK